ncbi:MAG: thiamine phosphate synthase [Planctomycetota bacterium]|nr:thiamine phosphate synthase [Planctomycetota bacterium]
MTAPRLCLVLTRELCRLPPLRVLEESIRGGADLVQLREKSLSAREFAAWTEDALAVCRALGVPLVVNDSVEIAAACGADGVHLGQADLAPADARKILGPGALIGWSTRTSEHLDAAAQMRAAVDYVGFGPAFPSATKEYAKGLGAERVREAAQYAQGLGLTMLAIGGITVENRGELGPATGVAVSSALCASQDPHGAAWALLPHAGAPFSRTLGEC